MTIFDPENTNNAGATFQVETCHAIATEAITANALVAFTMASDGVLRVALADTDTHDPAVRVGVAPNACASGMSCLVVTRGPCVVQTPATGPAISELLILTSTAGVGDGVAADATTVTGDTHGVFLTDEIGTSNTCWVWIN